MAARYVRQLKANAALRGETLTEVAATTGIPRRVMWSYTDGSRRPTVEHRRRLAEHFEITETELFADLLGDDGQRAS